jgi:threonine/homoserine/homoserine lactone efflux protein
LAADLLNPKMGAFYLAVLPQFVPAGGPVFRWSMVLIAFGVGLALR